MVEAVTPEGIIKQKIKKLLDSYSKHLYYYMPVPSGYGSRTVDYLGCCKGVFFAIEAKRPKGKPTALQQSVLEQIRDAGGVSFVVNDDASLAELERWLDTTMTRVTWSVGR